MSIMTHVQAIAIEFVGKYLVLEISCGNQFNIRFGNDFLLQSISQDLNDMKCIHFVR